MAQIKLLYSSRKELNILLFSKVHCLYIKKKQKAKGQVALTKVQNSLPSQTYTNTHTPKHTHIHVCEFVRVFCLSTCDSWNINIMNCWLQCFQPIYWILQKLLMRAGLRDSSFTNHHLSTTTLFCQQQRTIYVLRQCKPPFQHRIYSHNDNHDPINFTLCFSHIETAYPTTQNTTTRTTLDQ